MIRVRGVPVSDDDIRELVRRLAREPAAAELVARLRRALDDEVGGLIATNHVEARALLVAVDALLDRGPQERLLELRASLAVMLR